MRPSQFTFVFFAFLFSQQLYAGDLCLNPDLADQPILAEGRPIPLGIYADHLRKSVFTSGSCSAVSSTALYCFLSFGKKEEVEQTYSCRLDIKAEHVSTFALLGLPGRGSPVSPELARSKYDELLNAYHLLEQSNETGSGAGLDLSSLLQRISSYEKMVTAEDWRLLLVGREWKTLAELRARADAEGVASVALTGRSFLTPDELRVMGLETLYERTKPFTVAVFICLLGLVAALAADRSRFFFLATPVLLGTLIVTEVAGVALRVLISGRAPVTNMFETVMWVGLCVLVLSTVLGILLKNRQIFAVGFVGNAAALFMMVFANRMLDGGIQPLVPVLRSNFWLSTHVTSVTSSYACFMFSAVLANFVLAMQLLKKAPAAFVERWNYVIRIAMQIGTVLLAAGVILGGVWADYSWGRFWGWDPKETWSLIALIVYIGILHGRYVGWFRGLGFARAGALGFLSIIMAWFGVNNILAVGLHSYGFSSGGVVFVVSLVAVQVFLSAASYIQEVRTR